MVTRVTGVCKLPHTTFLGGESRAVIYNKCTRVASGSVRAGVKHVRDPTLLPRENMDPLFGTTLIFVCVWDCVHKDLVIWIHFLDHALDTSHVVHMEESIPEVEDKVFFGQCVFYNVH